MNVGDAADDVALVCLQHLYNLVHVDLSYNNLRVLESAHTHLGNIKTLNLAGNTLDQLTGLTKLYSLVNLDLSHNQLALVTSPYGSLTRQLVLPPVDVGIRPLWFHGVPAPPSALVPLLSSAPCGLKEQVVIFLAAQWPFLLVW